MKEQQQGICEEEESEGREALRLHSMGLYEGH